MQSQVASGELPLAPFLLSSLQEDYPSPSLPSPSLVFFFFRLLCLSVSSSLSHLWPFILPQPSLPSLFFSWYFSSLLREGFLVEVSPSWQQGRQMYSRRRSHKCTTRGFCGVERWHIEFFCGSICAFQTSTL